MASLSDLAGKRVLVTGASGFTGRYMVAELRRLGCTVIGAGGHPRNGPVASSPSSCDEYHAMDLVDAAEVASVIGSLRPDNVVHLAAVAYVGHGNAEDFYKVNQFGTRNLLAALAALDAPPSSVLLASSANIYGNSTAGEIAEDVSPAPANDYAVSKLAMEYIARLWQDRLPLVITRPFNYTGVGQADNFLIPKIVSHFRRREHQIELGNIDVWRDFGDVRSVVETYGRLLACPDAMGRTVNVCTGSAHSLRDVIDHCTQITGHEIQIEVNPAFVRENEVRILKGSNALLSSLVGSVKSPPLSATLEWMLSSG